MFFFKKIPILTEFDLNITKEYFWLFIEDAMPFIFTLI